MKHIILSAALLLFVFSSAYAASDTVFPAQAGFFSQKPDRHFDAEDDFLLLADWSRWAESGRNLTSDATMERLSAGAGFSLPGDCYAEFRILSWRDDFNGPFDYDADGSSFSAHAPVAESWTVELNSEKKDYEKPEAEDVTAFGAAVTWAGERAVLSGEFQRRPEVYNLSGLLQGIESDSWSLALEVDRAARLLLEAEYVDYNDDNEAFRGLVAVEKDFDAAGRLTPGLTVEYRDAREKSYLLFLPGGSLLGITHPYWAPRNYTSAAAGLDYHLESAKCGVLSASVSITYDTDKEFGAGGSVQWTHSSIIFAGQLYRSDVWDSEGIMIGAQFAF